MHQDPGSTRGFFWKLGKAVILAELGFLGICYVTVNRLNTDRNFRFRCWENFPTVLDNYYWITTFGPDGDIRQQDLDVWKEEGKIK